MLSTFIQRASNAVYNAAHDLRFGRPLTGEIKTRYRNVGAKDTANSDYRALDRIFAGGVGPDDVLVDVGCGKGRVINWWLSQGYDNPIIGVEIDPAIATATRARLRRYGNVSIRTGNILDCLPVEGTLFYMYNPFHADVVKTFAQRLAAVGIQSGGPLRIVYNNCKYLSPFTNSVHWTVDLLDRRYTDPYDRVAVIDFLGSD